MVEQGSQVTANMEFSGLHQCLLSFQYTESKAKENAFSIDIDSLSHLGDAHSVLGMRAPEIHREMAQ